MGDKELTGDEALLAEVRGKSDKLVALEELPFFIEQTANDPVQAIEKYGEETANTLLSKATDKQLTKAAVNLAKFDVNHPGIDILNKELERREGEAETKIEEPTVSETEVVTNKGKMEGVVTDFVEVGDEKISLPEKGYVISGVSLNEGEVKGKGSGQEIYKKALNEHGVLYSSFPISEDAMRVQNKLVEKGIAKIETVTLSDGTELRKITPAEGAGSSGVERKKEMQSEYDKLQKDRFALAKERDEIIGGGEKYRTWGKKQTDEKLNEIRDKQKQIDEKQTELRKELKVIEAKEKGSVELFDHYNSGTGSPNTIIYDIKENKLLERENVARGKTKEISIEDAAKKKFASTLRGRNEREIKEAYTEKEKAKYEAEVLAEINKYKAEDKAPVTKPEGKSDVVVDEGIVDKAELIKTVNENDIGNQVREYNPQILHDVVNMAYEGKIAQEITDALNEKYKGLNITRNDVKALRDYLGIPKSDISTMRGTQFGDKTSEEQKAEFRQWKDKIDNIRSNNQEVAAEKINKESGVDIYVARQGVEADGSKYTLSQIKENGNTNTFLIEDASGN